MHWDLGAEGAELEGGVEAAVDACNFGFFRVSFGQRGAAVGPGGKSERRRVSSRVKGKSRKAVV